MSQTDSFDAWLQQFTYLSEEETSALIEWQRPIAFVHQFIVSTANDGAGSLFYNHPECVEAVALSLAEIGEAEIEQKIRAIECILEPYIEAGSPDPQLDILEQIQDGAAETPANELTSLVNDRWSILYSKLEGKARAHGWKP